MASFEWIIVLLVSAAVLAEVARRLDVPYPTLLAIGGVGLAFVPHSPRWVLDPELALTLFVAPVLLDAAYDTSPRDLRANWKPVAGLVVAAVASTVVGVAAVCRWLVPDMPWAIAIALGAIVAPPDAAAATAVMRQVGLPHRVLSILEGESLLNDASALLVYRLALAAAVSGPLGAGDFLPTLFLTVGGSIGAGLVLAHVLRPVLSIPQHAPTSLILQFASTFGVWILAERVGLSGILTMVAFAMTMARGGGPAMPARLRVPIWAVWDTVVFVLNALAFVLIGLQLRPIWERLGTGDARLHALTVAGAVLVVVIAARFLWVMGYSALANRRSGPEPVQERSGWRGGVVVAWSGMRGIVTLAAAFALPETLPNGTPFPHRDLVLLCAFAVVFGTLVLQGLTMKPLIRRLALKESVDPVAREIRLGRVEMYHALLASLKAQEAPDGPDGPHTPLLVQQYQALIDHNGAAATAAPLHEVPDGPLRRHALAAARQRAIELRSRQVIGEAAYRALVQELDWAELAAGGAVA